LSLAYSQLAKTFKEKQEKTNSPEPELPENKLIQRRKGLLSWAAFLFSISIVIISLVSVVFPALIASSDSTISELHELGIELAEVDPFSIGFWALALVAANIVVFGITILYFKNKLPSYISKSIEFIFNFEVSKKIAFLIIILLLAIYVASSAGDLFIEEEWEDYPGVKQRIESWSPEQITSKFEPHVRYFLLWSSFVLFGNYTIIPFIASISLLLLTYFFTAKISKKRFAGIIAFLILIQSNIFLTYDSTVSYTNYWILFYLLSLYLVYKIWPLSPVAYLLSIPSKALTVLFLPMSLFFIYRSEISRKRKIILASTTSAIILAGTLVTLSGFSTSVATGSQEEFDSDEFWLGFSSFSYQLRFDGVVILFILPLIVGLFVASRNGIKIADSIMVLIGGILLTAPLLTGFTEQTNQPYRFVPLVVFFAIGVGVLLSKRKN